MLKRDGGRVWLDLDEYYPPPKQHPNTVFKSMAIAFTALGGKTTYVDLMGVSAAAFRIQVGGALCPSSPHPHLGFSCAKMAHEALGYSFLDHKWDDAGRREKKKVLAKVVESIDNGRPMITAEEESGLLVGYLDEGKELLVREPYSKKGDEPTILKDDPWWFGEIVKMPQDPSQKVHIRALETAVANARAQKPFGNNYYSGFAAFDRWMSLLRDEAFVRNADLDSLAIIGGNAHILYCLIDARRSAASYLEDILSQFTESARTALHDAARLYSKIAAKLDTCWSYVPWDWEVKSESDWTMDNRRSQANVLEEILEQERQAIDFIEIAVRETFDTIR